MYVCAHAMLRALCSRYLDGPPGSWRFAVEEHGRPYLTNCVGHLVDLNLSHTTGLVACAFTREGRVGVDVEHVARGTPWQEIQGRVLGALEQAELAAMSPDAARHRFIDYWTLKESIAKAWGTGIGTDFRSIEVSFAGGAPQVRGVPADLPYPSLLHAESLGDHKLAVGLVRRLHEDRDRGEASFNLVVRQLPDPWEELAEG